MTIVDSKGDKYAHNSVLVPLALQTADIHILEYLLK